MNIILVIYSSTLKTVWDSFTLLWLILAYIRHACNWILFLIVMIVFAYLLEHSSSCHCSRSLFLIISFILELSDIFWVHLLVSQTSYVFGNCLWFLSPIDLIGHFTAFSPSRAAWPPCGLLARVYYTNFHWEFHLEISFWVLFIYACWTALRPSAC